LEQLTRPDQAPAFANLLAQIRESYGRVVYSHKAHEKCADIYLQDQTRMKLAQIILAAIATGGALTALLADSRAGSVLTAVVSTCLVALNLYAKNIDPGALSEQHKDTALKLWVVREKYLSLLADFQSRVLSRQDASARRDDLQGELAEIYQQAPRTTERGYRAARKALKVSEDMTFSDEEIDLLLPTALRNADNSAQRAP